MLGKWTEFKFDYFELKINHIRSKNSTILFDTSFSGTTFLNYPYRFLFTCPL